MFAVTRIPGRVPGEPGDSLFGTTEMNLAQDPASGRIRPVARGDVPALKRVIDATGLFPSALLDAMLAAHLDGPPGAALWLTHDDGGVDAIAHCAPERMTDCAWNLLLIAVHPDRQGRGVGGMLTRHVEAILRDRGGRILLVETSGLPEFEASRAFYRRSGFEREGRVRDFYAAGEDKIIFRKAL